MWDLKPIWFTKIDNTPYEQAKELEKRRGNNI